MSTSTSAFDDVLDPKTESQSEHGTKAARKVELAEMEAPLHFLDSLGIDVPHRDYNPDKAQQFPTTHTFEDGTTVSLFQDVREDMDSGFGDMGLDDDDDVIWTVVSLDDGTVQLTVVGDWGKRREVPHEDFADNYEPITLETPHGTVPQLGY